MLKNSPIAFVFLLVLAIACNKPNTKTLSEMKQGVKGTVIWMEGNMMPSFGEKASDKKKGKPVVREVLFCKPTKMNDLPHEGTIFQNADKNLVKKTTSDEEGKFSIELPAGKYSVFTKEEGGYFANSFDGDGNVNIVEVKEGEITEMNIDVNYKAAF